MTETIFDEPEECWVGNHFLSSIINGDDSGLLDSECDLVERWITATCNGRMGHFAIPDEDDDDAHDGFRQCEITGMMSSCTLITFWPLKEKVA